MEGMVEAKSANSSTTFDLCCFAPPRDAVSFTRANIPCTILTRAGSFASPLISFAKSFFRNFGTLRGEFGFGLPADDFVKKPSSKKTVKRIRSWSFMPESFIVAEMPLDVDGYGALRTVGMEWFFLCHQISRIPPRDQGIWLPMESALS